MWSSYYWNYLTKNIIYCVLKQVWTPVLLKFSSQKAKLEALKCRDHTPIGDDIHLLYTVYAPAAC